MMVTARRSTAIIGLPQDEQAVFDGNARIRVVIQLDGANFAVQAITHLVAVGPVDGQVRATAINESVCAGARRPVRGGLRSAPRCFSDAHRC